MSSFDDETVQMLLKAFMQFRKNHRHDRKIAGYNPSEFKVLVTIKHGANEAGTEMKVSEISKILNVTSPTITQIINALEKDGLVERTIDPEDRRAVKIKLTPAGMEVVLKARAALSETFLGLVEHLGEEDSKKLAQLLTKVQEYFNRVSR